MPKQEEVDWKLKRVNRSTPLLVLMTDTACVPLSLVARVARCERLQETRGVSRDRASVRVRAASRGRMSHVGLGAVRKALCEFASLRADHFVTSLPSQVTASGFSLMGARRPP